MTRGTREKESARQALEGPDIAQERQTDGPEANHLALTRLANGSPTCFSGDSCDKANCVSRTDRSQFTELATRGGELSGERPGADGRPDDRYTAQRVRNLVLSANLFHAQMIKTAAVLRC